MKLSPKTRVIILLSIPILIGAVVVAIDLYVDRAVKDAIESAATDTLNAGVSVDKVDLSIMEGKLRLKKLLVENTPGYQHNTLLELNSARIDVDVETLASDVVRINEIRCDGVDVFIEHKGILGNNLWDMIRAMPRTEQGEGRPGPTGKKIRVDRCVVTDLTIRFKLLPISEKSDIIILRHAPIKISDLGSDNNLDIGALCRQILLAIVDDVIKQDVGALPKDFISKMKTIVGKVLGTKAAPSNDGQK